MNCINPLSIPNKNYHVWGTNHQFEKELKVPCGLCCNCRANKRTFYEALTQFQMKKFHGIGTFLTITYDDYHLPYQEKNLLKASLRHEDVTLFLRAVRRDIRKHFPDCDSSSHDFKFIYVGEYGEHAEKTPLLSGRPHYHLMLFGLSPKVMDFMTKEHWKHGKQFASLPIQQGCARYVMKYLDKSIIGGQKAKEKYENQGLERPRLRCSTGLVTPIIESQFDYIRNNGGEFIGASGLATDKKMLSPYYRNKFLTKKSLDELKREKCEKLRSRGVKPIDNGLSSPYGYSTSQIEDFERYEAIQSELHKVEELRKQGIPYDHSYMFTPDKNTGFNPDFDSLVKEAFDNPPF